MTALNAALVVLDVDPSIARPGWIALVVTVFIGAALVLLFFSIRRQFRRISPDLPYANPPRSVQARSVRAGSGQAQADQSVAADEAVQPSPPDITAPGTKE